MKSAGSEPFSDSDWKSMFRNPVDREQKMEREIDEILAKAESTERRNRPVQIKTFEC
jgi:hypothetical protein